MQRFSLPKAAFAALALVKFGALLAFGPRIESDSPIYLDFAHRILTDTTWWHDAGLRHSWLPVTVFRPLGYPALLAAGQAIAGPTVGLYLVMAVQIVVGLVATAWVWRVARGLFHGQPWSLLVPAGFALSIGFLYDQSVMTDGLFGNIFVLLFAIPAASMLERQPPTFRAVLAAGLLAMVAHSVRGATLYLLVALLPILGLWLWRVRSSAFRLAAMAVVLFAPIMALNGGVMAWNMVRTGKAFYVANPPVPLQPLAKAAARGQNVFDGDTVIDREARATFHTYGYDEVLVLSNRLFQLHGLDARAAFRLEMELYLRAWRRHPRAMIQNLLHNINHHLVDNFFNVIDVADEMVDITTGQHLLSSSRVLRHAALRDFSPGAALLLVAMTILRVTAWLAFALFVAGLPVLLAIRWKRTGIFAPPEQVLAAGWLCFTGYVLMLCAVHFVARFTPAVLPWGLAGALAVASALFARIHRRGTA